MPGALPRDTRPRPAQSASDKLRSHIQTCVRGVHVENEPELGKAKAPRTMGQHRWDIAFVGAQ